MTISLDAHSSGVQGYGGSLTYSHTCSGSNRLLLVFLNTPYNSDQLGAGVTYGGVAMTRYTAASQVGPASASVYTYYLIDPATGANNVVITLGAGDQACDSISASFNSDSGALSMSAGVAAVDGYFGNSRSDNITTPAGGVAVDFVFHGFTNPWTPGSGQTRIGSGDLSGGKLCAASYKADATAMAWTRAGGEGTGGHAVIALAETGGGGYTLTAAHGTYSLSLIHI